MPNVTEQFYGQFTFNGGFFFRYSLNDSNCSPITNLRDLMRFVPKRKHIAENQRNPFTHGIKKAELRQLQQILVCRPGFYT